MLAISVREALRDAVGAFGGRGRRRPSRAPRHPSRCSPPSSASAPRGRRSDERRASCCGPPLFHTPANPFTTPRALRCPRRWRPARARRTSRRRRRLHVGPHLGAGAATTDWRGGFVLARSHRHPHPLSAGAHHRQPGSIAARLARVDVLCPKKRGCPTVATRRDTARGFVQLARGARDDDRAGVRRPLRAGDGRALRGSRRARPAGDQRPRALGSGCFVRSCISRRMTPIVTPRRLIQPLPWQGPTAVRRDATIRAVDVRSDARDVPDASPRASTGVRVQTHLNEKLDEIAEVRRLFPWAADYLERVRALRPGRPACGDGAQRLADRRASSNGWRPAGPRWRTVRAATPRSAAASSLSGGHLAAGVHCALGTDVGGGTGFGMLKEALAGVPACSGWLQNGLSLDAGTAALPRDTRRRDGARTRQRRRRLSIWQGGGPRLPAAGSRTALWPPRWRREDAPIKRSRPCSRLATRAAVRDVRVEGASDLPNGRRSHDHRRAERQRSRDGSSKPLGWIFEHSPWVAERAWAHRPFADSATCTRAMVRRSPNRQPGRSNCALLRAHPDLGTRARMSDASVGEQAGAGLDRLTAGRATTGCRP